MLHSWLSHFHLYVHVQALYHHGSNLPSTSGTEPATCVWANNKIRFVWVHLAMLGGNKGVSVKLKLVASWPDDGIV